MSELNLSGLLPLIEDVPSYRRLLEELRHEAGDGREPLAPRPLCLLSAARPYLIAALQRDLGRPMVVVTARVEQANRLYEQLRLWSASPDAILRFPEPEALPYERIPWNVETIQQRIQALTALGKEGDSPFFPPLIVASARALTQKTIPPQEFLTGMHTLRRGQTVPLPKLLKDWLSLGYEPASVVVEPGTFSRRGGIVDIFSPASPWPVRIELFGDEIESLRLFDPSTQRSLEKIDSFTVVPASEALPSRGPLAAQRTGALDLSTCHEAARAEFEKDLKALEESQHFKGIEFYIPHLYPEPGSLIDFLPPEGLLTVDDLVDLAAAMADLEAEALDLRDNLVKTGELPAGFVVPYFTWDELQEALSERRPLVVGYDEVAHPEGDREGLHESFTPSPRYGGQLKRVLEDCRRMKREGQRVVVVSRQAQRLAELWGQRELYVAPVEEIAEPPLPRSLTLVRGTLDEGWVLQAASSRQQADSNDLLLAACCHLLTDAEIFGWARPVPRRMRRPRVVTPEAFFADIQAGDYVVHTEHGIGIFRSLVTLSLDGVEREYLQIDYAGGDKLYVPVHQPDRLSRYVGIGDRPPALHRLGTADWAHVKARAKRAVEDIARELLELYAAREVVEGHAFSPDTPWQAELEASFPYSETEEQLRAIEEIKADMEKPKPMDRLVCGDVGYGKTEVALRAAFKAAMDGKQVAVLVPTTVLAQQHYETFQKRLAPFPVKVEMLSRFRSRQEQCRILEELRAGTVDIVVGTHRLLSDDVAFKDLGLLIIDEEQRFGVTHKEKLKQMRKKEVDVLTLTATPIPRTLYMSLTGVRDISTIETPPEERLPVKTYVGEYDEALIRRAILRELDRGGQVYFVHNRVQSIHFMARRLAQLVPEATMAIAHGQMREEELSRVMLDFAAGKIDVLVCTSIIQSGLDIPNANTLIVNRAYQFGLADLYQLRGRVGRGAMRAYAYFLYDRHRRLTEAARRRLQTILEASELGAGFNIAMRDLEIRGAGDLLGTRQHGHIAAIGFDLYCKQLAQAVRELKEGAEGEIPSVPSAPLVPSVSIDLHLPAFIPDDYVPDSSLRLRLYRHMAGLTTLEEVEGMARELEDRFGKLPGPVANLIYQLRLKVLALKAGVQAISQEDGHIVIKIEGLEALDLGELQQRLGPKVRVGHHQIWLPLHKGDKAWQAELVRVLEVLVGN